MVFQTVTALFGFTTFHGVMAASDARELTSLTERGKQKGGAISVTERQR